MENTIKKIRLSLLFFFCIHLFAYPMVSKPVCIHAKIKNNTSGTIIIDNGLKAGISVLSEGESKEIEYWRPLKIIFPDEYSRTIDCFEFPNKDKMFGKINDLFAKSIVTYSFEVFNEKISCLAKDGSFIYRDLKQSILYDEISIVRSKSENSFVRIKIKNNNPLPVRLISFDAFIGGNLPIQIKENALIPITLRPSEEYTLRIPCNVFIGDYDYSKIKIKTDCPQQPCLECHIYLSNELSALLHQTD